MAPPRVSTVAANGQSSASPAVFSGRLLMSENLGRSLSVREDLRRSGTYQSGRRTRSDRIQSRLVRPDRYPHQRSDLGEAVHGPRRERLRQHHRLTGVQRALPHSRTGPHSTVSRPTTSCCTAPAKHANAPVTPPRSSSRSWAKPPPAPSNAQPPCKTSSANTRTALSRETCYGPSAPRQPLTRTDSPSACSTPANSNEQTQPETTRSDDSTTARFDSCTDGWTKDSVQRLIRRARTAGFARSSVIEARQRDHHQCVG